MTSYGMEYPFGQFGRAVPAASPPSLPPIPGLLLGGGQSVKETERWLCVSPVQQHPKHGCAVNTVLITNANLSTIWAAVEKVNPIPARPSIFMYWVCFLNYLSATAISGLSAKNINYSKIVNTGLSRYRLNKFVRKFMSIHMGIHMHQSDEKFACC